MAAVGVLSSCPAAAISRSRLRRIVRSETSRMEMTPPHVRSLTVSGSATASNQRRLPSASLTANSTRKRSPRAARRCGRSSGRNGRPATSSSRDLGVRPAEQPVVDHVGRDRPALVIDRDDGVADAGQDRAEAVVLLLGRLLLLVDGERLQTQVLGPRGQVLVGDAQLLDGRRQLLVERLELFVGRLELLVEGLDLLASRLGVLARAEHRVVRQPEVGDLGRQLVIRPEQPVVAGGRLVEPLAQSGRWPAPLAFDGGHVGQLDDGRLDRDPSGPAPGGWPPR